MTTKITGSNISSIANTGVTWNAVTVADGSTQLSASAGNGYFLDTNTGVIEVFLPASPTRGDTVILADYSGTFSTNKVIVNTGGKLIDSTIGGPAPGNEFEITTNNSVVELVFVDNDKGWLIKDNSAPSALDTITASGGGYDSANFTEATGGTVTTTGNFKIHTFTGDGNFIVSAAGTGGCHPAVADYLVVAGGGGGGFDEGGGGGGGGFRESSGAASGGYTDSPLGACVSGITLTAQTYPITVGAGGAGGDNSSAPGANSVFSTITSAGGGAGAKQSCSQSGAAGGSGGASRGTGGTGGAGNTPPVSPPQGNNGAQADGSPGTGGGGGGGATQAGAGNGTGGNGATTNITASPVTYSGGGGGTGGTGGTGGAGNSGQAGTANTGGGGGGTCTPTGSAPAGGKGIVVIRYKFQ